MDETTTEGKGTVVPRGESRRISRERTKRGMDRDEQREDASVAMFHILPTISSKPVRISPVSSSISFTRCHLNKTNVFWWRGCRPLPPSALFSTLPSFLKTRFCVLINCFPAGRETLRGQRTSRVFIFDEPESCCCARGHEPTEGGY